MNPKKMITDKEQKLKDDITIHKSKIAESQEILQEMEYDLVKMEKKRKGLKTYLISWVKNYYATGEEEIEASTEEEALQIAKDNIGLYEGSLDCGFDDYEVESWGEVKK